MIVVFVSGPYRGNVEHNIIAARRVAVNLWRQGYAVICPHLNTANFDAIYPDIKDDVWLTGDLELLKRCDAICMVDGWEKSEGSRVENQKAIEWGKEFINYD